MIEERPQSDGAIYTNDYKNAPKQPDWTGKIQMNKELLRALVNKVKSGEEAEVRVALWDRVSKNGNSYKYARMDIPQKPQATKSEDDFSTAYTDKKPEPKVEELSDDDIPF